MFALAWFEGVFSFLCGPIFCFLVAIGYLIALPLFGAFVLCVRAWNIRFSKL